MCRKARFFPVKCEKCGQTIDGLLASRGATVICPSCSRAIKVDSPERVGVYCDGGYC